MTGLTHDNIIRDAWLSDIFGYDVFRLILDSSFIQSCDGGSLEDLQKRHVFVYSKVSTDNLEGVCFLETNGFNLVDTNIVFDKEIVPGGSRKYRNPGVRFARKEDEDGVVGVAGSSFTFSRFHLDMNIPDESANRIKVEWARNYFRGNRGDSMIIAENGQETAGFLQLIHEPARLLVIDLIAVQKENRREGLAHDMIMFAEQNCGNFGKIRVGTQLTNIPSIRFYESIGFRHESSQYIFHYTN